MFDIIKEKTENSHIWGGGVNTFMCTFLSFKLLKIRNKTSSPKDFEFTRFDSIYSVFLDKRLSEL